MCILANGDMPVLPVCLQVRLASVRRSLFTSEQERFKFLNRLVAATRTILDPQAGRPVRGRCRYACSSAACIAATVPPRTFSYAATETVVKPCPRMHGPFSVRWQGLAEHDNFHELCRLLGRLKTNYQLSELVRDTRLSGGREGQDSSWHRSLHAGGRGIDSCMTN